MRTWEEDLYRCGGLKVLFAILATLALAASAASADFLDSYKAGKEAIERGQWSVAEQRMREAIAGRTKESGRIIKRAYVHDYIPHYYLGLALFHQGNCDGALASWDESERQGFISKRKEGEDIQEKRHECEQMAVAARMRLSRLRGETQELLRQAAAAADAVAQLATDPDLSPIWDDGPASFAERRAESEHFLDQARKGFEQASSDAGATEPLQTSHNLAQSALQQLESLRRDAVAQRDKRRASQAAKREERLREERAAANAAQRRPRAMLEHPSPETAPPEIVAGAEAYFAGSYAEAVEILGALGTEDPHTRAHASLLLAAAQFALYYIGGGEDEEILGLARRRVREAVEASPSLRPSERAFSPRFRRFYESALEDVPAASTTTQRGAP